MVVGTLCDASYPYEERDIYAVSDMYGYTKLYRNMQQDSDKSPNIKEESAVTLVNRRVEQYLHSKYLQRSGSELYRFTSFETAIPPKGLRVVSKETTSLTMRELLDMTMDDFADILGGDSIGDTH